MVQARFKWIILIFMFCVLSTHADNKKKPRILKIAIIGAGAAGLASAKRAIDQGHDVTVYEQGEAIGGIWYYTDSVGNDTYGNPIHSPMYLGLRTNSPYQTMEFPDYPYPNDTISYPSQETVLKYLNSYADHFKLKTHIKLHHLVVKVTPIVKRKMLLIKSKTKWKLTIKNLPENKTVESDVYDAVFVCTGVASSPNIPDVLGADVFKGKIMHSHDYRRADDFEGENVLVIGSGASSQDILTQLINVANRLTSSQRKDPDVESEEETEISVISSETSTESIITYKDGVEHFTSNGVTFVDGTRENFTVIIYATGYRYSYPFLGNEIGIKINENSVETLYKQILNIEHPTMAFIGIPQVAVNNRMYDLQAQFALKFISGAMKMPTKSKMRHDFNIQVDQHLKRGFRKKEIHILGLEHNEYYKELADTAKIENIPNVISDIFSDALKSLTSDPFEYRKNKYIIKGENIAIKLKVE